MSWLKKLFGQKDAAPSSPPTDSEPKLAAKLLEAEKMAAQLQDYLLSEKLFWQIVVDTPAGLRQPKMTLGALYQRIQDLEAEKVQLGPNDRARLAKIQQQWDRARRQFPQRWRNKLRREYKSYLNNWKYFLEQRSNSERWAQDYPIEARNHERVRLVLRLLGPDAADLLSDYEKVEALDKPPA
jgi:hypothetical protein